VETEYYATTGPEANRIRSLNDDDNDDAFIRNIKNISNNFGSA
jgi:hypothetical protein